MNPFNNFRVLLRDSLQIKLRLICNLFKTERGTNPTCWMNQYFHFIKHELQENIINVNTVTTSVK